MKHIRKYKLFESNSIDYINHTIDEIDDVLQELYDENWAIDVSYGPKRWSETYKSDLIEVTIKKKQNKSQSMYPPGSEFNLSDVSDVTNRLINSVNYKDISIKICKHESYYDSHYSPGYKTGVWDNNNIEISNLDDNIEILGIKLTFYLDGDNLDNFQLDKIKKSHSNY